MPNLRYGGQHTYYLHLRLRIYDTTRPSCPVNLGHKDINMMLNRYSHVTPNMQEGAARILGMRCRFELVILATPCRSELVRGLHGFFYYGRIYLQILNLV